MRVIKRGVVRRGGRVVIPSASSAWKPVAAVQPLDPDAVNNAASTATEITPANTDMQVRVRDGKGNINTITIPGIDNEY